jgi:hypothetical protein
MVRLPAALEEIAEGAPRFSLVSGEPERLALQKIEGRIVLL